jgi:hypothetical protein
MQEADLDGLLLFQPEAFRYAIGASAGVATMWGRAGAAIAFVPADAGLALAAVVSDHALPSIRKSAPDVELRSHRIWIDTVDTTDAGSIAQIDQCYRRGGSTGERPETFDREVSFGLLGELLRERGLSEARLGVDVEFMPAADFAALKHHLPRALLTDGSTVLRRLRSVKTPVEIARLRLAANAAEAGIVRMVEAIRTGSSVQSLSDAWKSGAKAFAIGKGVSLSGSWDYISVGPDLSDANQRLFRVRSSRQMWERWWRDILPIAHEPSSTARRRRSRTISTRSSSRHLKRASSRSGPAIHSARCIGLSRPPSVVGD